MYRSTKIVTTLLICISLTAVIFISTWIYFLKIPLLNTSQDIIYIVTPKTTLSKLAQDLQQKGLLNHPKYFIYLGQYKHLTKNIRVGEYRLAATSTPQEILDQLIKGKVIEYPITFIEGWTFSDVRHKIAEETKLNHYLSYLTDQQLMTKLGISDQHPEGLFFPDTYFYERNSSDIQLLKRAYHEMQKRITNAWNLRADNLPYKNPLEAVTVASLVEKESAIPQERAIIAGVILQRLKKNMLLQIDPTVIYGMGDQYKGRLTKADLKIDSPYNTYLYKGLPPTPISLPSEQSLYAALHPQFSDYYYYVAKGDGSHYFSKTYDEQKEAINKYLKR